MITLYLDIDGTLVSASPRYDCNFPIAKGCFEFLNFATLKFECKWLSFHTRGGKSTRIYDIFEDALGGKELSAEWKMILDRIEPAFWIRKKSDAINFKEDFLWVDNDVDQVDYNVLAVNDACDSIISVYINTMPYDLLRIKLILTEILDGHENQATRRWRANSRVCDK